MYILPLEPTIRVLVLEDDDNSRELLVEGIKQMENTDVTGTSDFEVAKQALREGKCDVYITDLRIDSVNSSPFKNGADLLQMIKRNSAAVARIATSQWADDLLEVKSQGLADIVIPKEQDASGIETLGAAEQMVRKATDIRNALNDLLLDLFEGSTSIDFQHAFSHYRAAKDRIRQFCNNHELTKELRKAAWSIQHLIFHLAPIDAPELELKPLSTEALRIINHFLSISVSPNFSFRTAGLPLIAQLERLGFQVSPRFSVQL